MNILVILSIVWLAGLLIAHVVAMIKNETYRNEIGINVTIIGLVLITALAITLIFAYFIESAP